jgi:hypothetical protein
MCQQTFHGTEKPLRYDRMSGLDSEQLDELVLRIEEQLVGPWDKGMRLHAAEYYPGSLGGNL